MKIWYIWGTALEPLEVKAQSFDDALEVARKINPKYDTGKLKCIIQAPYDTTRFKFADPLSEPIISSIREKRIKERREERRKEK